MGAAIGDLLAGHGHDVVWAAEGRGAQPGPASAFTELPDVATVAGASDLIFSVLPSPRGARRRRPGRGGRVHGRVRRRQRGRTEHRARGESRRHDRRRVLRRRRDRRRPTDARHEHAALPRREQRPSVAELFTDTPLGAIVLPGEPGAASALKVCYAAYTKGTTALLLAIRSLASAEGVDDALLAEWAISQPDLVARSEAGPRGSARKGVAVRGRDGRDRRRPRRRGHTRRVPPRCGGDLSPARPFQGLRRNRRRSPI